MTSHSEPRSPLQQNLDDALGDVEKTLVRLESSKMDLEAERLVVHDYEIAAVDQVSKVAARLREVWEDLPGIVRPPASNTYGNRHLKHPNGRFTKSTVRVVWEREGSEFFSDAPVRKTGLLGQLSSAFGTRQPKLNTRRKVSGRKGDSRPGKPDTYILLALRRFERERATEFEYTFWEKTASYRDAELVRGRVRATHEALVVNSQGVVCTFFVDEEQLITLGGDAWDEEQVTFPDTHLDLAAGTAAYFNGSDGRLYQEGSGLRCDSDISGLITEFSERLMVLDVEQAIGQGWRFDLIITGIGQAIEHALAQRDNKAALLRSQRARLSA